VELTLHVQGRIGGGTVIVARHPHATNELDQRSAPQRRVNGRRHGEGTVTDRPSGRHVRQRPVAAFGRAHHVRPGLSRRRPGASAAGQFPAA
jgi:hypothetical protein